MSITKHKLSFDPAESDDYDVVASYLRAADGTLITHTGAALDVNIKTSDITLEVNLDFANDSVDASGSEVSLDAATLAALESVTVTATDLDIRDLAFATDSVDVSGSEIALDAATLAALETITVVATDLDIRDLTHATDSIKIGDGTDFMAVESDGSINVNASEAGYSSCLNAAKTIAATATDIVTTELANRKELTVQNVGNKDIYIGCDASVTTANGLLVPKGATASFRFGAGINVHAISDGGTSEVRLMELA